MLTIPASRIPEKPVAHPQEPKPETMAWDECEVLI